MKKFVAAIALAVCIAPAIAGKSPACNEKMKQENLDYVLNKYEPLLKDELAAHPNKNGPRATKQLHDIVQKTRALGAGITCQQAEEARSKAMKITTAFSYAAVEESD